jgi:Ca-activated chloride channel family protein
MSAKANLPREALDHAQLPRLWARARVGALLEKIQREGEEQATIDEIIRLARQYKFVTPYTSFLAVPRALLRPRVIRPGDPVLRVKTDESISSVTALFPFGLVQRLRYLSGEDVWQTRFLAPDDMQDGTYTVRLVLRDRAGHTYREFKTRHQTLSSRPDGVSESKRFAEYAYPGRQAGRRRAGGAELGCTRRRQRGTVSHSRTNRARDVQADGDR